MAKVDEKLYSSFREKFPIVCTDGVIIKDNEVLLVKRKIQPFKNFWTLPGGHIDFGESSVNALIREVKEETGYDIKPIAIIDVFDDPKRDPWGHVLSISYLCVPANLSSGFKENSEVETIKWFNIHKLPDMIGFDHLSMIKAAEEKFNRYIFQ